MQRRNDVSFEEDFNKLREEKKNFPDKTKKSAPKRKKDPQHWLLLLQIFVCSMVLLACLILRFSANALFQSVQEWYSTYVNQSILLEEDWDNMRQHFFDLFPSEGEMVGDEDVTSSSDGAGT